MNITVDWVKGQVALIRELSSDDEAAHGIEDDLYQVVLTVVAEGHPDARELAAEALKSREIEFSRWHG